MVAKKFIKHKQLSRAALCFLCFFVALSFVAPLLPIANASSDTMPCCAGKAGHCDSGITPKRVSPPTSEPMCGLKEATMENDGITIVAEPVHTQHSHSRHAETSSAKTDSTLVAESNSLSQPCRMDCGACLAGSTRPQKRERALIQPVTVRNLPLSTTQNYESLSIHVSSRADWEQASPRGPPSELL